MLQKVFGNREMFYNQLMPSQAAPSTDFNGRVMAGPIAWLFLDAFWHKKISYYVRAALKKSLSSPRDAEVIWKALLFLLPTLLNIHSQCSGHHHIHILPEAPVCLFCTFPGSLFRSVCIAMNSECAPQTIPEHQKRNRSAPFLQTGL